MNNPTVKFFLQVVTVLLLCVVAMSSCGSFALTARAAWQSQKFIDEMGKGLKP